MLHTQTEHDALLAALPDGLRYRHKGRKIKNEGTRMACPHCDAQSEIRTSRMVSKTMRELIYACTDMECGHTFVATTEIQRTLSPSAKPNPRVNLPLSAHVQRDMMRVVLDNAGEAAHQSSNTTPMTGDLFAGGANTS